MGTGRITIDFPLPFRYDDCRNTDSMKIGKEGAGAWISFGNETQPGKHRKTVAKKTKDFSESLQLKSKIAAEKDALETMYRSIGRQVYEHATEEEAERFAEEFLSIQKTLKRKAELEEELAVLEGAVYCEECGAKLDRKRRFLQPLRKPGPGLEKGGGQGNGAGGKRTGGTRSKRDGSLRGWRQRSGGGRKRVIRKQLIRKAPAGKRKILLKIMPLSDAGLFEIWISLFRSSSRCRACRARSRWIPQDRPAGGSGGW